MTTISPGILQNPLRFFSVQKESGLYQTLVTSGRRSGTGAVITSGEVNENFFFLRGGAGSLDTPVFPCPLPLIPFNPIDRLTKKEKCYALCTKEPLCYLDPSVKGTNCYK